MVVTCETCQARYRLDDARLSPKGSKARCKKCGSMMVIPPSEPPVSWADDPTRPGPEVPAPPVAPARSAPVRHVIGGDRSTARTAVAPRSEPVVHRPEPAPRRSDPAPVLTAALAARVAPTLDFRKVGMLSWRARSQRGRLFDFADLRALRAHLADGRLTEADAISPDGKVWSVIGAVPNLDVFFVQVWERMNAQRGGAPLDLEALARTAPVRPAEARAPVEVPTPGAGAILAPRAPRAVIDAARADPPPRDVVWDAPRSPPPSWRRFEGPIVAALVAGAFVGGVATGALWMRLNVAPQSPTATLLPPDSSQAVRSTTTTAPSVPVYQVGGTRSGPTPTRTGLTTTTPSAPVRVVPSDRDAIEAAATLTPSGAGPGEAVGVVGEDGPSKPSDLILVQEIPPDQVDRVLRAEGLAPQKR